jgi:hypothetical protein
MKKSIKILGKVMLVFMVILVFIPLYTSAQDTGYTPISAVPNLTPDEGTVPSLEEYLGLLFNFIIGIGAVLAVVQITLGGVKYMTSSVAGSLESAKSKIRDAILGLLLLLSTYIILSQINPDILQFRFGNNLLGQASMQIISSGSVNS